MMLLQQTSVAHIRPYKNHERSDKVAHLSLTTFFSRQFLLDGCLMQLLLKQLFRVRPYSRRMALWKLLQRRKQIHAELLRCFARKKRRKMVNGDNC